MIKMALILATIAQIKDFKYYFNIIELNLKENFKSE